MVSRLKRLRLTGKRQFDAVFSGRKIVSPSLVFYFAPNGLIEGRLGIIAGKKVIAGSVERNRFKRRIRELFWRSGDLLSGTDIVVLARKGCRLESFRTVERSFQKLLGGFSPHAG